MNTINCTPKWKGVLPALLIVLQDGNAEGKKQATIELKNMAQAADQYREVATIDDNTVGETKEDKVATNAELVMWDVVSLNYPEIKTGDFPPDACMKIREAIREAVKLWVEYNRPKQIDSIEAAKEFLIEQIKYVGSGFHPDTDFEDYEYAGRYEEGRPGKNLKMYSAESANEMNEKMNDVFYFFGNADEDIYEFCLAQL